MTRRLAQNGHAKATLAKVRSFYPFKRFSCIADVNKIKKKKKHQE
jgi:hypothetical protein